MPCGVTDEERRHYRNLSNTADLMNLYLEICWSQKRDSVPRDSYYRFAELIDVNQMVVKMCEHCENGEEYNTLSRLSLEAQIWWRDHKEKDKKRKSKK